MHFVEPEPCALFSLEALLLAEHMNIDRVHVVSSMSWQGRLCVENKGLQIVGEGQGLLLDGKWQFSEGSTGTFSNLSLTNGNNVCGLLTIYPTIVIFE